MSVAGLPVVTIGSRLDSVGSAIAGAPWFAAVGEPMTPAEYTEAEAFADVLQSGALKVAIARDWHDAARIARDARWSRAWWNAEEQQRQASTRAAENRFGRHHVMASLSSVMTTSGDLVHGKAALAASRAGIADPALTRAAAGAAAMACHQLALAVLVDAPEDHPFRLGFRLFAAGRWPLCVIENQLFVF